MILINILLSCVILAIIINKHIDKKVIMVKPPRYYPDLPWPVEKNPLPKNGLSMLVFDLIVALPDNHPSKVAALPYWNQIRDSILLGGIKDE